MGAGFNWPVPTIILGIYLLRSPIGIHTPQSTMLHIRVVVLKYVI